MVEREDGFIQPANQLVSAIMSRMYNTPRQVLHRFVAYAKHRPSSLMATIEVTESLFV